MCPILTSFPFPLLPPTPLNCPYGLSNLYLLFLRYFPFLTYIQSLIYTYNLLNPFHLVHVNTFLGLTIQLYMYEFLCFISHLFYIQREMVIMCM